MPTLAPPAPPAASGFELRDRWLRVHFSPAAGDHADFHYLWLRHNCDHDRHPMTRERTVCPSELPENPRPAFAKIEEDPARLVIGWEGEPGRAASVYPLEWLREHAYARGEAEVPPPPGDVAALEFDAAGLCGAELARAVLGRVAERGLVVGRGFGGDTEAFISALEGAGLEVRPTHFGRIEDLRTDNTTNRNTDQLGYTDYPVKLHTDMPFLDEPPRYQLLHCVRPAEEGGANYAADGLAAARWLEREDPRAFELLTTVPVRFHRKQRAFERLVESPVLRFGPEGDFVIRYSYFTMAPQRAAFGLMEEFYRAYRRFARLVNDPRMHYRAPLAAGDFLLYDNRRMLHAREGFKGARWVRGVYFDPKPEAWRSEKASNPT